MPTSLSASPSDHPGDRPVNAKPTGTTDDQTTPATPTNSSSPSASATSSPSTWLPSFFPTFGVGPKTQIWIYGSAALIAVFCASLGVYFFLARRKRLRNNPRDDYEFEILREETEGLTGNGGMTGKGKRRAGELYDAFAAGSEDEDDESAGEGDGYADRERHVVGDDDEDEDDEERRTEKGELLEK